MLGYKQQILGVVLALILCFSGIVCQSVKNRDVKVSTLVDDQTINTNQQLAPYIVVKQNKQRKLKYVGVNLSGAEFGDAGDPIGTTYDYPTPKDAWYFMQHGINMFRIPIRWERLQPTASTGSEPLDTGELKYLDALVAYITANKKIAHVDVHNFCRYKGAIIGNSANITDGYQTTEAFANFFGLLVGHFMQNPYVEFTIMNEPNLMQTDLWVKNANAAIAQARSVGYKGVLYVNGNRWSGCFSWMRKDVLGQANAVAMLNITDPASNIVFDCHNYFNVDNSGLDPTCVNDTIGADRVKGITDWLRTNKFKAILGEFGGAMSTQCMTSVKTLLDYLEANSDVWLGGCWWSAGPKWGNYYASLQPLLYNSQPKNQLMQLKYYATGTYGGK